MTCAWHWGLKMSNLTRYGVCYDLHDTPYKVHYRGIEFRFSTAAHVRRFEEEARKREDWLSDSLSRRFKFKFDASLPALLQLYIQIETRGFCVIINGKVYESRDELWLSGQLRG